MVGLWDSRQLEADSCSRQLLAGKPVIQVVTETRTPMWEEFGEGSEQDFWLPQKRF